jgi:glycosyltransferase involved in cell wall biosynthesis
MVNIIKESKIKLKKYDFSYVSLPAPHKNHFNLLKAWEILFERGIKPTLVLTVVKTGLEIPVLDIINLLIDKGVNIVNIGKVPFEEAIRYTSESRFTIYPSINETLGLGYVEAYYAGQKVLASDLQITHDVIKPSLTFDPFSPEDIADKVEYALNNELPPTELKLKNEVDKLIKLLTNNE